ncbi:vascular endothelial growth factor receptor 2-like isoform X4 [Penaeus japonicus]|uniref:vascular endothelial growth factor receptor 2-like isoform X4 n=2 Tax=Penaeus japonicus TaxID=27405 RepID=UPI001C70B07F|nr:vascular endothelial growth factor receptor 2-like isoform X4 [Penaeus japonicus]
MALSFTQRRPKRIILTVMLLLLSLRPVFGQDDYEEYDYSDYYDYEYEDYYEEEVKPPQLNVTDAVIVNTTTEAFFSLKCEGNKHLNWNWTSEEPAIAARAKIVDSVHAGANYSSFGSTLTITDPDYKDTGYYYCSYEWASRFYTRESVDTYVFVYDGKRGLVRSNESEHVAINTASYLELDCRPTLPDMDLKLFKDGKEVPVVDVGRLHFNPKRGYYLTNVKVTDSGTYECRTPFDSFTATVNITQSLYVPHEDRLDFHISPPRMNVTDSVMIDLGRNDTFSLECKGGKSLNWTWVTENPVDYKRVKIIPSSEAKTGFIEHTSVLTILDPVPLDTGYYYCFYEDVGDVDTDIARAVKRYVYVNAGKFGPIFIRSNGTENITISTSDRLIIDCKTTNPHAGVELFKNGEVLRVRNTRRISFHSKYGYEIKTPKVRDSGVYECRGYADKFTAFVVVQEYEGPKPDIDRAVNQYFVVGYDFSLDCSLVWNGTVDLDWVVPNPEGKYSITRRSSWKRPGAPRKVISLHVSEVTTKDSGEYKCTAKTIDFDLQEATRVIRVKESLDPFINISCEKEIFSEEGFDLEWLAEVDAFPPMPKIVYRDWTGKEVGQTDRVTTGQNWTKAKSWLRIKNASVADFGLYTMEASFERETETNNESVFIYVRSKPYVSLLGIPPSVDAQEVVNASCILKGYPLPEAEWTFQACPTGPQNCSASFEKLTIPDSEVSIADPGNVRVETASVSLTSSGYLRCRASNAFGNDSAMHAISISDIGGNFVFRHISQNKSTEITRHSPDLEVVEHDDFYLLCGVAKFSFERVRLAGPGLEAKEQSSQYTRAQYLKSDKASLAHEGRYRCTAQPHGGDDLEVREVRIKVHREEMVAFTEDANMRPEGVQWEIKETEPFMLNCTVTGMPKPVVKWFKDGAPLTQDSTFFDDRTFFSKDQQSIVFSSFPAYKHLGTYTCKAESRIGVLKGSATLTVPGRRKNVNTGLIISCVGISIMAVAIAALAWKIMKERKFRRTLAANETYLFTEGNIALLNPYCTAEEQAELLPYSQEWEIQRKDIIMGRQLGAGAYGRVVRATVTGLFECEPRTTVALKMCKSHSDPSQLQALTRELKIMIHLGKHLNVVNLLGASTVNIGKGELLILVEYCPHGNLLAFMHRQRGSFVDLIDPLTGVIDMTKTERGADTQDEPAPRAASYGNQEPASEVRYVNDPVAPESNLTSVPQGVHKSQEESIEHPYIFDSGLIPGKTAPFTTLDLVSWGWQVAQGMDYLSRRKVLHGDLAARNLLLADNNVVKISDFGLSRDMYRTDIYMKKGHELLPLKWMSVEAIRDRLFSVQSDVWSYGVTLWELFTLGSTPYPAVKMNMDFVTYLQEGNRMDKPKYANQEIYNLLLDCWNADPGTRPTFGMCAERLGALMLPTVREGYTKLNHYYVSMNEERFRNETDYLDMLSGLDYKNLNRPDEFQDYIKPSQGAAAKSRERPYLSMQPRVSAIFSRLSGGKKTPSGDTRSSLSPERSEERVLFNLPLDKEKDKEEVESGGGGGEEVESEGEK